MREMQKIVKVNKSYMDEAKQRSLSQRRIRYHDEIQRKLSRERLKRLSMKIDNQAKSMEALKQKEVKVNQRNK